jgi:hypothetical protein
MPETAENVATEFRISRADQDAFAWRSQQRAAAAIAAGRLADEIVPVTLPAGTTPILLKVCNNRKDWGFIFRITDAGGIPVNDLKFQTNP